MKIHFIGVGKMGLPMARHLQVAGHQVSVSDIDASRHELARLANLTVVPAQELGSALTQCEVVLSSLPHDLALLEVAQALAEHGATHQSATRKIWVDTSTVSLASSAKAARLAQAHGFEVLRCTVSGNNHMAEAAQLTVMSSGPQTAYERVLPCLRCFGAQQFYLGEGEKARLMKLVINLMIAQTSAMLAEALTLGQKGGLDWASMWPVITHSAIASPIIKAKAQQLSQRDFTPTFTVEQMLKDVDLILDEGRQALAPLPQTALTRQALIAALAQGFGQEDYAAIIKSAEKAANVS